MAASKNPVALLPLVLAVVCLLIMSCLVLPEVDFQKNYGRWGQVACGGNYVCDNSGLCCTRCVNLDNGSPLMRCHDLTPQKEVKDALGF